MTLASCLYEGVVQHRRHAPVAHRFAYRLFMLYLDLEELPTLFSGRWFWSARGANVAWFRRQDHFGPSSEPLDQSIRGVVESSTGVRPNGPIRLLTHLRYVGFVMNPISLYYCFHEDKRLAAVVAEVTNTPWGERDLYVLDAADMRSGVLRTVKTKRLHVSPFLAMDYSYHFRLTPPGHSLTIGIANEREGSSGQPVFDATAIFRRRAMTGVGLARVLCRYPFMTARVAAAIYWQAFLLWRKGVPYVPHPKYASIPPKTSAPSGLRLETAPSFGVEVSRQETSP